MVEASGIAYDIGRHNFDKHGDDGDRVEACKGRFDQVVHWGRGRRGELVTAQAAGGSWLEEGLEEGAALEGEQSFR